MIEAQQLGQPARVDLVTLVAFFHGGILPRIAHHDPSDMGFKQVVQPGGPGSFFKGDVQISMQPVDKLQNDARFRLDDTLQHHLAGRIHDRDRDTFLVNTGTAYRNVAFAGIRCNANISGWSSTGSKNPSRI